MVKQFLEAGEFVTTHGILGELKIYPWTDDATFLLGISAFYLDENGRQKLDVEKMRVLKNTDIVKLKGIDSIEAARMYIGKTIWLNRDDVELEEGQFFVQDLLGAKVVNADTKVEYGIVQNVLHPGKHDVYEIVNGQGEIYLFPAVEEFVVKRNIEKGIVLVRPIAGMFEKEEKKEKSKEKRHKENG